MGNSTVSEVIGVFAAIVVLAGFSVAIINGEQTAGILNAAGSNFVKAIQAATMQKTGK